jgi:cytochrome b involved in lipid metabolism
MGVLGISLIVASLAYVAFGPRRWLPPWLVQWRSLIQGQQRTIADAPATSATDEHELSVNSRKEGHDDEDPRYGHGSGISTAVEAAATSATSTSERRKGDDKATMPPPPPPVPAIIPPPPTIKEPLGNEEPILSKPSAAAPPAPPVPSFTLSEDPSPSPALAASMMPPPPPPSASSSSMMPPPRLPPPRIGASPVSPVPGSSLPPAGRLPQFPAANSAQRARGPIPNRNPMASTSNSSGLALPPTHSSKPNKPSRKVLLTPGHSPLDWARISGPNADLRGVPASTPYMRVTPSMLKKMTGRKGKDAWMALNGKVYNITPYADFHPGGVPELMRGAGRDGTRLFGEVHPWVNYENMLSSCLIGLLVDETEGSGASEMEQMD